MIFKGNTLLLNIMYQLYPSVFHRRRRCNMFVSLCSRLIYFHRYLKGTSTVLTMILPVPMSMPAVIFIFIRYHWPHYITRIPNTPRFHAGSHINQFLLEVLIFIYRTLNQQQRTSRTLLSRITKTDMTIFIIV